MLFTAVFYMPDKMLCLMVFCNIFLSPNAKTTQEQTPDWFIVLTKESRV